MRKIVLAAAMAGTALSLSACSGGAEEEEMAGEDMTAEAETADESMNEGGVLDANTATVQDLESAGMTAEQAEAVVAGQPYETVTDLNAALTDTMSEGQAAAMLGNVFVPVNLNSASEEEIRLIPGMTDRMVGEFLEYRPYEDMAEFDREIGKYVDEEEVARFRNYVTL